MNTRILVTIIIFVVVLTGLGVWVGSKLAGQGPEAASRYSAVYLTTGDIYFGELSWFPWPHLNDVWLLQRGVDAQNQVQFGVVPFTNAFWSPISKLYLSPKQVVFWTRLRNDSEVARYMANPGLFESQQQLQAPSGQFPPVSGEGAIPLVEESPTLAP